TVMPGGTLSSSTGMFGNTSLTSGFCCVVTTVQSVAESASDSSIQTRLRCRKTSTLGRLGRRRAAAAVPPAWEVEEDVARRRPVDHAEDLAQLLLVEVAHQAPVVRQRDRARLFGDDDRERVGALGDADRGAVARAQRGVE